MKRMYANNSTGIGKYAQCTLIQMKFKSKLMRYQLL